MPDIEQRAAEYIERTEPKLSEKFPKLAKSIIPLMVGFHKSETEIQDCGYCKSYEKLSSYLYCPFCGKKIQNRKT